MNAMSSLTSRPALRALFRCAGLAALLAATGLFAAAQKPVDPGRKSARPRIYVATDLEGVAGIYRWQQTREINPANPEYQEARRLLMGEIDAVITGCLAGGAGEIIVRDAHHGAHNAIPEQMNSAARYICGAGEGLHPLIALDDSMDAVILLGYHAMAGTKDGVLNHTKSSASGRRYYLDDREIGEIAMDALTAGHYGAPVILVSGDAAVCRETREFLGPDVLTVCTKTGYATEAASLLPPVLVRRMLASAAEKAVRAIASAKVYRIKTPVRGRLAFPTREFADGYKPKSPLTRRVGDLSFERVFEDLRNVAEF
jgi:D-amino peptidase